MTQFTHLHVHSHFSILDGMAKIPALVSKCKKLGMYSMALTDHGNMFGIKELLDAAKKENGKVKEAIKEQEAILTKEDATEEEKVAAQQETERLKGTFFKPIVGIEAYCAPTQRQNKDSRGWHLVLLAKNRKGYQNLCKLTSIAYTEGVYYNPRIDHDLLEQYHDGIIASSACLAGEIPSKILRGDLQGAEESVRWFKNLFGDDFYLELMRHKTDKPNANTEAYEEQQRVNSVLIEWARKYDIKLIATNDVHFVDEDHAEAHDRLICVSTRVDFNDPNRMHYSKQEWLKSPDEMLAAFEDIPEALSNTMEIAAKVESFDIDSDPLMPMFPIPEEFGTEEEYRNRITPQDLFDEFTRNENGEVVMEQAAAEKKIEKLGGYNKLYRIKFESDYLEKLVYEGAKKRYGDTLDEVQKERIRFELHTIKTMGFPGYFLIVSDYIRAAREELDVSVGPGRGSAAGSVVAYCLKITDVDPLQYDLLFERFLNPDRISLPDIDVDFEDTGRPAVLDWITKKYGADRVAHIITYGVMATKSSIADVARISGIPVSVSNKLKDWVPERNFDDGIKDEKGKAPKVNIKNCLKYIPELRTIMEGTDDAGMSATLGYSNIDLIRQVLRYAEELEDTNRQIGIHACGVIIGADDLTNVAPLCTIKDKVTKSDVLVTQYDGHVVESVGLIKMDFLGLSNLTVIKDTVRAVKKLRGEEVDIDAIPIDDELTYKLYQEGNTIGTFQFESAGMQKYLRDLKPTVFGDLIAMNALYRPGPMDYIPSFIERKQGREPIEYDLPEMEEYLKETYGITVYQEQVMLLSRKLANFTRGESDTLRKAMGKKQIDKMLELKGKFMERGQGNGHDPKMLDKIWNDWEKFASYAFNKSHSTCYAWVAYQTAYLKAHYPAEYMAAIMSNRKDKPDDMPLLLGECRRMGLQVLSPDINESEVNFSVNKSGQIYYGFSAIKGMGDAVSQAIVAEREKNGPYTDVFDLLQRVSVRTLTRSVLDVLVKAGALDAFDNVHRAQYFHKDSPADNAPTYSEKLIRWAARKQESVNTAQMSIFSMSEDLKEEEHPPIPSCDPWTNVERCRHEMEAVGFYLKGHPLDDFALEIKTFTNRNVGELQNLQPLVGCNLRFGCIVTEAINAVSQKDGSPYGRMVLEDYKGSYELSLYGDQYQTYKNYFQKDLFLYVSATVIQNQSKPKEGQAARTFERLKITGISLLNELLDTKTRSISFRVNLKDVTPEFCAHVKAAGKEHRGKATVGLIVEDLEDQKVLRMKSLTLQVKPKAFVQALQAIPAVYGIKLNDRVGGE